MSHKIYIVVGTTGEYSDHTQWNVAAYLDKEMAELHAKEANKVVNGSSKWDYEEQDKTKNPYDPCMRIDYTGTSYEVVEETLYYHFDEFQDEI